MAGRKPIKEEDEPKFLAALATMPLRDVGWITLMLNTGFRVRETMSLDVSQVIEAGRVKSHITVARRNLKGGAGCRKRVVASRRVPINPTLRAVLESYLFSRFGSSAPSVDEPLFPSQRGGRRLSRWRANEIIREVLRRAGIEDRELYGTHSLRKAYCWKTYIASGRCVVTCMHAMAHQNLSSTQKYLPVDEATIEAIVMSLGAGTPDAKSSQPLRDSRDQLSLVSATPSRRAAL